MADRKFFKVGMVQGVHHLACTVRGRLWLAGEAEAGVAGCTAYAGNQRLALVLLRHWFELCIGSGPHGVR